MSWGLKGACGDLRKVDLTQTHLKSLFSVAKNLEPPIFCNRPNIALSHGLLGSRLRSRWINARRPV